MKFLSITFFFLLFCFQNIFSQENIEFPDFSETEETGNYQEVLIHAKKMLEKDSLNDILWVEIAKLYRLNQQYKQAIGAYEMALKINPTNHKLLLALAKTNRIIGKKEGSIKLYKEFLQYEPNNIMALSDLAQLYSSDNLSDSAAYTYKKLHLLDTLNVEYLQKMANSQWFSGNLVEGFKNYKKALRLDSTYLPVVFDLSRIYINTKSPDSAIAILEMNIKYSPLESRLHADLGNAYFSDGNHFMAVPNYEKAIQLGYKGAEAFKRLAISYYSTKDYEKSKQLFESLISKDTTDYKVCMYLGNIYNQLNDPSKGLHFFNLAIELLTPDPMVITAINSGIVDSYHAKGAYAEEINAIQIRQESTPMEYKSPKYLVEIAGIYENNIKNKQKALKYYQEYYSEIKKLTWFSLENKNIILSKINKLKEEIHLEK